MLEHVAAGVLGVIVADERPVLQIQPHMRAVGDDAGVDGQRPADGRVGAGRCCAGLAIGRGEEGVEQLQIVRDGIGIPGRIILRGHGFFRRRRFFRRFLRGGIVGRGYGFFFVRLRQGDEGVADRPDRRGGRCRGLHGRGVRGLRLRRGLDGEPSARQHRRRGQRQAEAAGL